MEVHQLINEERRGQARKHVLGIRKSFSLAPERNITEMKDWTLLFS